MVREKLGVIFRKHFVKCMSTNPLPNVSNYVNEAAYAGNPKEREVLQSPDYFNVHNLFTVKDLFDAKVHYGHKEVSIKRNMKPFVFGSRLGHIIFDLDITAYHLREALNFTAHIAYRNGIILFISRNPRMTLLVEKTAKECKEYAVAREWRLGTLIEGDKSKTILRYPDLCIILNTLEENGFQHQAIVEAAKMCIPTVGIVDSNCDPNLITYPVPGNDDSLSCFELYCELFKKAILRGKNERQKHLKEFFKAQQSKYPKTSPVMDETTVDMNTLQNKKKTTVNEEESKK